MVMFVILIMMIVLRMYTCVKAYQVLHYKYMPFVNYTSITHIRVCICVCVRRAKGAKCSQLNLCEDYENIHSTNLNYFAYLKVFVIKKNWGKRKKIGIHNCWALYALGKVSPRVYAGFLLGWHSFRAIWKTWETRESLRKRAYQTRGKLIAEVLNCAKKKK